jgi:hypothetical protein
MRSAACVSCWRNACSGCAWTSASTCWRKIDSRRGAGEPAEPKGHHALTADRAPPLANYWPLARSGAADVARREALG